MVAINPVYSSEGIRRHRFSVFAIITDEPNRSVLLVRRRRGRQQWTLPGGKAKGGETLRDALQREVVEETGLQVEPIGLVAMLELALPRKTRIYFQCRVLRAESRRWTHTGEIMAKGYFPPSEIPTSRSFALRLLFDHMPDWPYARHPVQCHRTMIGGTSPFEL
jgi:ADP-ribose pyrophosphatase YjhB (NUDIX family)